MILQEVPPSTPSMGALSSSIKKRRTTDADWERYQSKIVRLYIDEKRSREDVISIMKSEDGLDITEKQLKYRIEEKWKVRKNGVRKSSTRDRNLVKAFTNRECSTPGCLGLSEGPHTCKCSKRPRSSLIKPLPASINTNLSAVTSLISARNISDPNPEFFISSDGIDDDIACTTSQVGEPLLWMNQRVLATGSTPAVPAPLPQYHLPLSNSATESTWCDLSMPGLCDPVPYVDLYEVHDSEYLDLFDHQARLSAFFGGIGKLVRNHGSCIASPQAVLSCDQIGSADSNQFDQQDPQQATGLNSLYYTHEQVNQTPNDPHSIHYHDSVPLPARRDGSQNSTDSMQAGLRRGIRISVHSVDLERMVLPLQNLEKHILQTPNNATIDTYRHLPRQSVYRLSRVLQSDWIRSGINNILGRIYQSLAEKRLNMSTNSSDHSNSTAQREVDSLLNSEICRVSMLPHKDARFISVTAMKYYSTEATITAELRESSWRDITEMDEPHTHSVYFCYMPNVKSCLPGVSVLFTRPQVYSWKSKMTSSLRAFNVIPNTSQIVKFVKANNIDGVQTFLQAGKASIDDISSDGHSLLMYALVSESWDVFELLVREGADIQHCTLYSKTYDLITCIWRVWLHCFSPSSSAGTSSMHKSQKLIEMINLAKSYGCDLVLGSDGLMHPNISFHHISRKSSGSNNSDNSNITTNPAKCFMHQVCDIEQRNDQGQSALLFEAMVPGLRALTRFEVFLSLKANHNAIDIYGRGALHSVLFLKGSQHHGPEPIDEEDWFTNYGFLKDETRPWTSSTLDYHDPCSWTHTHTNNGHGGNSIEATAKKDDMIAMHCNPAIHYTIYPKLVALLNVGCDPNLIDNMGLTPSDYAFKNGRWSYWIDALETCGWIYEFVQGLCLRRVD